MRWSGNSQQISGTDPLRGALPLEPLPERLPWQVATVVILGLSLVLWSAVGAGIARLLG